MVLYPLVARALSLPPELAGLFIGGAIHDMAQVVGAGFTLGPQTGDVATIVKLFRVAMLALVVGVVSSAFTRARAQAATASPMATEAAQPLVPWCLWLFVALVAVNSAGALTAPLLQGLGWVVRAGELECHTLLRLGGEERDFMILYPHGFVSGRANQQLLSRSWQRPPTA